MYYVNNAKLHLLRPGKRNHLSTSVGAITALEDPTKNRKTGALCSNNPCKEIVPITNSYKIDGVLSISAAVFSDGWDNNSNNSNNSIVLKDEYGKGRKGIWRPSENYVYIADRNQSGQTTDDLLDLKEDGDMDNVMLFDWNNPFYDNCGEITGWRSTGFISRYNDNNASESKNALGLSSSALNGYNNYLNTAVAGNAKYHEIAFENFEEPFTPQSVGPLKDNSEMSHISLLPRNSYSSLVKETYDVLCGSRGEILVDIPLDDIDQNNMTNMVLSQDYVDESSGNPMIKNQLAYIRNMTGVTITDNPSSGTTINLSPTSMKGLKELDSWSGRITIYYDTQSGHTASSADDFSTSLELTDEKAHTGNKSLKVLQPYTVNQDYLHLSPNKEYVISAWITSDVNALLSPERLDDLADQGSTGISVKVGNTDVSFHGTGEAIEGWRRMEGRFKFDGDFNTIALSFSPGILGVPIYVDDLRIHPADASMMTSVYDPHTFRLLATLDDNNFATFYKYQPNGQLFLLKQETEKGIVTIHQSQSHIKPKTP